MENIFMDKAEGDFVHQSDEILKVENKKQNETEKAMALMRLDVKHYLLNKWTLWLFKYKSKIWEENMHEISSFDTAEDFWCVFNNIKRASQLSIQSNYSFFKYGIKPDWNDEKNIVGGQWLLKLPPPNKCSLIDEYWKQILMSLINELYESSEINGAMISIKKRGTQISVWTNNASKKNEMNIMAIGEKIKKVLSIQERTLSYVSHSVMKPALNSKTLFKI